MPLVWTSRTAATIVAVLIASACAGEPAATPSTAAGSRSLTPTSELATLSPTALPSPIAEPSPMPEPTLGEDTIGEVIVTDLVVRSAPGVGEDSEIHDFGLTAGDLVYVIEGPVPANGYDWLLVSELVGPFAGEALSAGWIAPASREGEPWVVPAEAPCPTEISVEAFASVAEGVLLYCYGGDELTLEGALGFCPHSDPVIQEPAWLGNSWCSFEKLDRPLTSQWPSISIHFDPASDPPSFTGEPVPLRVTGRFDAPIAQTCRYADGAEDSFPELTDLHEKLLVFECRSAFVVESAERLE